MSHSNSSDTQLQNLLDVLTEAVLTEQSDLDHLIDQYNVPQAEINGLIGLIRGLHTVLVRQPPSEQFVHDLKEDLFGHRNGVIARIRHLPARVQIAAGLTLVAGFMLFSRRRLADDSRRGIDIPILQG